MSPSNNSTEKFPTTLADLAISISSHISYTGKFRKFQRQYANDRIAFAYDVMGILGKTITFYQEEILGYFDDGYTRVAVRGPHGLGKTFIAAMMVHHAVLTAEDDAKIITTASAWRQLEKYLWPEIHKLSKFLRWDIVGRERYSNHELLSANIILSQRTVEAFAVASDDHSTIEGAHARQLTYIFDEAKAIPRPTWDAAEGAFSNAKNAHYQSNNEEKDNFMKPTSGVEYAGRIDDDNDKPYEETREVIKLHYPQGYQQSHGIIIPEETEQQEHWEGVAKQVNEGDRNKRINDLLEAFTGKRKEIVDAQFSDDIVNVSSNDDIIDELKRNNIHQSIGASHVPNDALESSDENPDFSMQRNGLSEEQFGVSSADDDSSENLSENENLSMHGNGLSKKSSMKSSSVRASSNRVTEDSSVQPSSNEVTEGRTAVTYAEVRVPQLDALHMKWTEDANGQFSRARTREKHMLNTGVTEKAYAFAISTPGDPSGQFYDIHMHRAGYEDWKTRHVTVDEAIKAGRISPDWVMQRERQWGRDSSMFQNRVLGEFADNSDEGIVPLSWIRAACERWKEWHKKGMPRIEGIRTLGVDVARGGDDKSVIARCMASHCLELLQYSKLSVTAFSGHIKSLCKGHEVHIEMDGGLGASVYDILKEQEVPMLKPIIVNSKTRFRDRTKELHFYNVRAAMWWNVREMLDPRYGSETMLPPVEELILDLSTPHWEMMSDAVVKLEEKKDIVLRLGRSTDYGDAVCLGFWKASSGGGIVV